MYVLGEDEEMPGQTIVDNVWLSDNYTLYTKNIVCKTSIIENSDDLNKCISLGPELPYSDYINKVKSKIPESKYNPNNVKLTLRGCIKTCPLQLRIDYKSPDISSIDRSSNVKIYIADGKQVFTNLNNLKENMLYDLVDGVPQKLTSYHTFKYAKKFSADTNGVLTITEYSDTESSPMSSYSEQYFAYDEQLRLVKDTYEQSVENSKYFGIRTDKTRKATGDSGFFDNQKNEVLLPDFQILNT